MKTFIEDFPWSGPVGNKEEKLPHKNKSFLYDRVYKTLLQSGRIVRKK